MSGNATIKQYLWPVAISLLGIIACIYVIPKEMHAVDEHILGFPDTDITGHRCPPLPSWLTLSTPCHRSLDIPFLRQLRPLHGKAVSYFLCLMHGSLTGCHDPHRSAK